MLMNDRTEAFWLRDSAELKGTQAAYRLKNMFLRRLAFIDPVIYL